MELRQGNGIYPCLLVSFLEHMKCLKFNVNTNCPVPNHHVKKGKARLHDDTVTIDLDLEPIPLGSGFSIVPFIII